MMICLIENETLTLSNHRNPFIKAMIDIFPEANEKGGLCYLLLIINLSNKIVAMTRALYHNNHCGIKDE